MDKKRKYYRDGREIDEGDALDRHGTMRAGVTMRLPMRFRDGLSPLQRSVRDASFVTVGTNNPLAMNRPGYRIQTDAAANDARVIALRDYEARLTSAWRDHGGDKDDYEGEFLGQHERDVCTISGAPGQPHVQDGRLICVPDSRRSSSSSVQDERLTAIAEYNARIRDAWRQGK